MQVAGVNSITEIYKQLSTLRKVNSAADNPAGIAISQKLISSSNGYDVGNNNAGTSKDLLSTAEGGLSKIQDSLQRMRELSVQASNGIYNLDDKQAIQDEIDALKSTIQDAAKGTEFNTIKLLDGSKADLNLALNPSGSGMTIQLENTTLETLGIADFDVTGDFDITAIDNALRKVSESRSSIGSTQNVLEHKTNYNSLASINLQQANGRIIDLDAGRAVSDKQKEELLNEYKLFNMKESIRNSNTTVNRLLGF
ncbi:flagellin [Anaerocolumna cellulosilytica]|uniref:Flagellin n=1 Tax=Anaerocolumna cellulosilytica TaxID=433286 RepID=A0A6S6R1Z6_9FIRM|nr:flagellin [Anaerocolumna cellulosilytica]MBB5197146.1 flagellin [Anaerocolumna cellulosilytica]BCJ95359.1 flagellin [Anaerocolumna cellulosilytica]